MDAGTHMDAGANVDAGTRTVARSCGNPLSYPNETTPCTDAVGLGDSLACRCDVSDWTNLSSTHRPRL